MEELKNQLPELPGFRSIGVIKTNNKDAAGTPIQPAYAQGTEGTVVLDEAFSDALDDLDGFERIWLIFLLDRAGPFKSHVVPYRDNKAHGTFATRSPCRPNPIGMSVVRLVRRQDRVLMIADVDILDGTPLLDIKPYIPVFDAHPNSHAGWFSSSDSKREHADSRFHCRADAELESSGDKLAHCQVISAEEVILRLDDVCIQTRAKRVLNQMVASSLVSTSAQLPQAAPIDLLARFLEETDFGKLRSQIPQLRGGNDCLVRLFHGKDGNIQWELC
jgi:tRNA (adenine37-N6)-methyltransferase